MKNGIFNFFLWQSNHALCSLEEIEDCKVDQDNTYNTSNSDYKFSRRAWERKIVKSTTFERRSSLGASTLSIGQAESSESVIKKRCERSYSAPSSKYQLKTQPQSDNQSREKTFRKTAPSKCVAYPDIPGLCQE